jgi:CHAT domain-containing protein
VVSIDLRASFSAATHETFRGLVRVLMVLHAAHPEAGYGERAFGALERERSHALDMALVEAGAGSVPEAVPAPTSRIAQIQNALFTPDITGDRQRSLLRELDDAERDLAMAESGPAGVGRQPRATRREHPALTALQQALGPTETVVEYRASAHNAAAFVVTATSLRIVPLSMPPDLDARIDFFVNVLQANRRDASIASGHALASMVLDPVLAHVTADARLLFVTSGSLARLPFAALPVIDQHGRVAPLLARHEVSYLPSLTSLASQRRQARGRLTRRALAVADAGNAGDRGRLIASLPASRAEARAVALPGTGSRILIGADATERAVKEAASDGYSVLHLATHAVLDATVPERSAVLLGASDGEDGLLQSREIYQLPIAGSLVMLSGCRTADGQVSGAEGLRSLARAFLQAGGRTVVGSLWDLPDRGAARMIATFYTQLDQGRDAGAALRTAKLSLAGNDPYASSHAWAALVLQGDPSVRMDRGEAGSIRAVPVGMATLMLSWLVGSAARNRRARRTSS